MSIRRKFERKVREKEAEIQELEYKLREAKAYLQAMNDAMKLVPNEGDTDDTENLGEAAIRPGTSIHAAMQALREHGKPLHIMDLLKAVGREPTAENRSSLGSSLAAYVRRGMVFTRPAANTYGLAEWGGSPITQDEPPPGFGIDRSVDNA